MKPIRIQRSRQHKQISPNGLPIVYCGRPSKHGNPFRVKAGWTRERCVEAHRNMIEALKPAELEKIKNELRNKNLSCWCKLTDPCHVDTLLQIANK